MVALHVWQSVTSAWVPIDGFIHEQADSIPLGHHPDGSVYTHTHTHTRGGICAGFSIFSLCSSGVCLSHTQRRRGKHTHMHMHAQTHKYTQTHTSTWYICMYIYIYIYIYTYSCMASIAPHACIHARVILANTEIPTIFHNMVLQ